MKITKEYLKTIIKEEISKLKENPDIDSTVDQTLRADMAKKYGLQSDELDAAQGILSDITAAANNSNLSDEQIAQLLKAQGIQRNAVTKKLATAPYTTGNMSGNPKDPRTRTAKAIKSIEAEQD